MNCDSKKICGWIQALAQLTVAAVILWVGVQVQIHLERMVESWEKTSAAVVMMQQDVARIQQDMRAMNNQMGAVNHNMGRIQNRMSPGGVMRGMMPW